jgi:adenylyltransferase/sulfurtransferase
MSNRYARQIQIRQIGAEGQKKLSGASAVVLGAGGLGSAALAYLAMAGVGRIGLIDSDVVELSNINRQFLHSTNDIGRPKAASAMEKLAALNPEIEIIAQQELLTAKNAKEMLAGYDVAVGAVDSSEARHAINAACAILRIPFIDGGIAGLSGYAMFLYPPDTPCYRCIFPETAKARGKEPIGALGATAGVIGAIQANIAIQWLLGLPIQVKGKLIFYDGLSMSIEAIGVQRNEACVVCGVGYER